jgi:hypothetical protein
MTAVAVRSTGALIPTPRTPADDVPAPRTVPVPPAVAYQRVLHQLVRRELRLVADVATWAPDGDPARIAELSRHAELIGRVLLHHHATEREAVWPVLRRRVPAARDAELRAALDDWRTRCARIDHMLRDVSTAARQWAVAPNAHARDAFAMACRTAAVTVDAQTAEEERALVPLIGTYVTTEDWASIARSSRCDLPARDQLLVLGLALEDACAADRARVLEALPRSVRWVWRHGGERRYRATVVRLRGEPPAR